jgi:hypothetical protein
MARCVVGSTGRSQSAPLCAASDFGAVLQLPVAPPPIAADLHLTRPTVWYVPGPVPYARGLSGPGHQSAYPEARIATHWAQESGGPGPHGQQEILACFGQRRPTHAWTGSSRSNRDGVTGYPYLHDAVVDRSRLGTQKSSGTRKWETAALFWIRGRVLSTDFNLKAVLTGNAACHRSRGLAATLGPCIHRAPE